MATIKTKKRPTAIPVVPYNYVVIEFEGEGVLSSGKRVATELENLGKGDEIGINNERHIVENVCYKDNIKTYIIFVTEEPASNYPEF